MNNILKKFRTSALLSLLLFFTVAFFLYKQYWLAFFSLALILIFPRWGQVKKIIIGKDKVEVQIPEDVIKKEQKNKE
ncbi:MAG: hypothetical protein HYT36_01640 [Candidatus Staskawiczbacteria bacterium]|nr:hypothetical protein [Candidatus Staskawiczbacteria bacterium]